MADERDPMHSGVRDADRILDYVHRRYRRRKHIQQGSLSAVTVLVVAVAAIAGINGIRSSSPSRVATSPTAPTSQAAMPRANPFRVVVTPVVATGTLTLTYSGTVLIPPCSHGGEAQLDLYSANSTARYARISIPYDAAGHFSGRTNVARQIGRNRIVIRCVGGNGSAPRLRSYVNITVPPLTTSVPVRGAVSTTTSPQTLPVWLGCSPGTGHGVVRPASLVLACATGDNRAERVAWSAWTPDHATGTGVVSADDCEPSCADGHFHSRQANLELYAPKPFNGLLVFSRLRVHLSGKLKPFTSQTFTLTVVP